MVITETQTESPAILPVIAEHAWAVLCNYDAVLREHKVYYPERRPDGVKNSLSGNHYEKEWRRTKGTYIDRLNRLGLVASTETGYLAVLYNEKKGADVVCAALADLERLHGQRMTECAFDELVMLLSGMRVSSVSGVLFVWVLLQRTPLLWPDLDLLLPVGTRVDQLEYPPFLAEYHTPSTERCRGKRAAA